jgi:cytoskeletal protein RodZ
VIRTLTLLLIVALLLITAHRLPAPIQEVPESPTPAATPVPAESAKPKPKRISKPKSEASQQATSPARQKPSSKQSRFAGIWVGTMSTIPYGSLPAVLTVDPTETAMAVSWYDAADSGTTKTHENFKPAAGNAAVKAAFAKAKLNGDTLTASFPAPLLGTSTWSLTSQPGAGTARVPMQAFFNDFTSVFHRSTESRAAKTAR